MESALVPQAKEIKTSVEAHCPRCKQVCFSETLVEEHGVLVRREVRGSFKQSVDVEGNPNGPMLPFCECKEN